MQENVVTQDMPRDGLQKHFSAALKALEKVGPAKAHQAFAGARQILNDPVLGLSARALRRRSNVIAQSVSREIQCIYGRDNIWRIETAVLIAQIVFVHGELDRPRNAVGKIR